MGAAFWKLRSKLWSGETGRALRRHSADVRELFIYLMSNDAANPFGVYHIERDVMSLQTGRSDDSVTRSLRVLDELAVAHYDERSGYVWVREMAAQQLDAPLMPKDRKVEYSKRWYARAPMCVWLGPFYDRYVFDLRLNTDPKPVERRTDSRPSPVLVKPAEHVTPAMFDLAPPPTSPADRSWVRTTFEAWYAIYPRKEYQKRAYQAWTRIKGLTPEMADMIIAALHDQLPHFNYKEGGDFVPHPATWINGECWNDRRGATPNVTRRTQQNLRAAAEFSRGQ